MPARIGARKYIGGPLAETIALISAMATPPNGARVAQINTLIKALKSAGVWTLLDAFYVLAAADAQAARLNWKSPGIFTLSPSNAPTFLADRGYTGDGATSGLSGPNLFSFGGQFSLNNAHMGLWCGTDVTEAASDIGSSRSLIQAHTGTTQAKFRANDLTTITQTISPGTAVGHTLWSRDNLTDYKSYKNGVNLATHSVASVAITDGAMTICNALSSFSTKRIQAAHVGAALTEAQIAAKYNAMAAYMTAVGA